MELKIPPPVWLLLTAVLMYGLAQFGYGWAAVPPLPWLSWAVAAAGLALAASGVWAFYRARTTVNPHRPENTAAIVDTGIYRFTRNPMYLGMALLLAAWALRLGHLAAWLGLPLFVWLLNRFQIRPEERILVEKFGRPYLDYCRRVRRWI